ncbi:tRNA pseudouridine synthase B-like [Ylistrum balloti]|uniref:tRNA pseudouridine synthase B-like n=1 Tax=Ylistrum balloti TaxID=509963 RepID=UPI00290586B6|nr:tRNA pseudouridine synthase B-like [Ylistrum balloti]
MDDPSVIFLNKSSGITSHTAIKKIQEILQCKKIGHSGTLDKFASGLVIVLLNKATKLSSFFLTQNKSYHAEIYFGIETDTLDPEGKPIRRGAVPSLSDISCVLADYFSGSIEQVPPLYSAVHVHGKRASSLARQGYSPALNSRKVCIHSYSIVKYAAPLLSILFTVSSGTYIRAIARDLGVLCNSAAYLHALQRTSIGNIQLTDAVQLEHIAQQRMPAKQGTIVHSAVNALEKIAQVQKIYVHDLHERERVQNGMLPLPLASASKNASKDKDFLALYDTLGCLGVWHNGKVCKSIFHI